MSKIQRYYDISKILSKNANINIIYGEKSNGKSYQVKHEIGVKHYIKTGNKFILMRRWNADVTNLWIEKYFKDVNVKELTDGKYEFITVYRKVLYFGNYDEKKARVTKDEAIGYVIALSTEQHMSSASFLDVDTIIFEEFFERGCYIKDEPSRLMIFYNTVDRKRGTTRLFCVGNTISKVTPYLKDWGLMKIVKNLKQGEIETVVVHNEENDVKIAIEYCRSSGGKTMAIGSAKSMIDKGSWQSKPQPHLPKSKNMYNILFRIGFLYQGFKFLGEFLQDKEDYTNCCWFIFPYENGDFKNNLIVFSDEINTSPYYQKDIYRLTFKNDRIENLLYNTFRESMIFYSDDLTGTDFKSAIDFMIRK